MYRAMSYLAYAASLLGILIFMSNGEIWFLFSSVLGTFTGMYLSGSIRSPYTVLFVSMIMSVISIPIHLRAERAVSAIAAGGLVLAIVIYLVRAHSSDTTPSA